jgi:hypothetical protein
LSDRLPTGWASCLVKEAGETSVGQQKLASIGQDRRYRYLRVANVHDDELLLDELEVMPFKEPERYLLIPGDVLLCEGQSRQLVGRAAIYRGEAAPLLFQNHIIRFRAFEGIEPAYALLVFRAYQKSGVFTAISKATTNMAHLGLTRFRELMFPLPPSQIQRRIVDTISEFQQRANVIRRSLSVCRGVLTSSAPQIVNRTILGGQRQIHSLAAGVSSWQVSEAASVVDQDAPIVYGILQPGPDDPNGVPYVRGQDLQQGYILTNQLRRTSDAIAQRYARSSLHAGDVLLGIIRHTRVAVVPEELAGGNITQGTARLRPGPRITSRFLSHWLSSESAQSWLKARMRGIDMPGLNLADVRKLPVPLPPLEEQHRMVRVIDQQLVTLARLNDALESADQLMETFDTDLVTSAAYGGLGRAISAASPPMLVEQTASALARSLRSRKRDRTRLYELVETGQLAAEAFQALGTQLQSASGSQQRSIAVAKRTGAMVTSSDDLREALAGMDGIATPEQLFTQLELTEQAVDSFYIALRDLARSNEVIVERSENGDSRIELVRR